MMNRLIEGVSMKMKKRNELLTNRREERSIIETA